MTELKPHICYSCGSQTGIESYGDGIFFIRCDNTRCNMSGPHAFNGPDAISKWNSIYRPTDSVRKDQYICAITTGALAGKIALTNSQTLELARSLIYEVDKDNI